jgi:hypothetical protein
MTGLGSTAVRFTILAMVIVLWLHGLLSHWMTPRRAAFQEENSRKGTISFVLLDARSGRSSGKEKSP